jgi:hypothetical protein
MVKTPFTMLTMMTMRVNLKIIWVQTKRNKLERIKYAKTAKRIDVKKLKEDIWKILIDNVCRFFKLTIVLLFVIKFYTF